jgi:hypothetical protein
MFWYPEEVIDVAGSSEGVVLPDAKARSITSMNV